MYVTIEGIVGCGKSTVIQELKKHLNNVHWFKEPIESFRHFKIHNPLYNSYNSPTTDAAICQLHIIDELSRMYGQEAWDFEQKNLIISERSHLSPLVFTKTYHELNIISHFVHDYIVDYWEKKCLHLKVPDLVVFLDVDVDTCQKRVMERARAEETTGAKLCSAQFQSRLRTNYLTAYPTDNIISITVNDLLNPVEVAALIAAVIKTKIQNDKK